MQAKIFVSSTIRDLKAERAKTKDTINSMEHDWKAVCMEDFSTDPVHAPLDVCLNHLAQCQAVVLLVGSRYGTLLPEQTISFTESEFIRARELNLPVFVLVKHRRGKLLDPSEEDPDQVERFLRFRNQMLREKHFGRFSQHEDLGEKIFGLVRLFESECGALSHYRRYFVPPSVFFDPAPNSTTLVHHRLPLVGRGPILDALRAFVKSEKRVAMLPGPGGLGKSKLLYEFARNFELHDPPEKVLFLRDGVAVPSDVGLGLPRRKCVLVVDDAQRQDDNGLVQLLELFKSVEISLILACRPYGVSRIGAMLARKGFDSAQIEILPELKRLGRDDLRVMANHQLGDTHPEFVEPLIRASDGSPLVLVVSAGLLNRDPECFRDLSRHEDFQDLVFRRFRDELLGHVFEGAPRKECQDVLFLIAALAPVSTGENQNDLPAAAQRVLGMKKHLTLQCLEELQRVGLVHCAGRRYRIVPDVLSDHVLRQACVTSGGVSTGYAEHLLQTLDPLLSGNLLLNLAELNSVLSAQRIRVDFLEETWGRIRANFADLDDWQRFKVLRAVEHVAHFDPQRSLVLIDTALPHLQTQANDGRTDATGSYLFGPSILLSVAETLRKVAIDQRCLPRALDILWQLGRQDRNGWRNDHRHPIARLRSAMEYSSLGSFQAASIALDAVERWLKDPNLAHYSHSPLDMLEPFLAHETDWAMFDAGHVTHGTFSISLGNTRPLRQRAFRRLRAWTKSDDLASAIHAAKILVNVLRYSIGLNTKKTSDETRLLKQEQRAIVSVLRDALGPKSNPLLAQQVVGDLSVITLSRWKSPIQQTLSNMTRSAAKRHSVQLFQVLIQPWESQRFRHDEYKTRAHGEARFHRVTAWLKKKHRDCGDLNAFLEAAMDLIRSCRLPLNADQFICFLAKSDPGLAVAMAGACELQPDSQLTQCLGAILTAIKKRNVGEAYGIMNRALDAGHPELAKAIARGYAWIDLSKELQADDIEFLSRILRRAPDHGKLDGLAAIRRIPTPFHKEVVKLLVDLDLEGDIRVADAMCFCIADPKGILSTAFADNQLTALLQKVLSLPDICRHTHWVGELVKLCSERIPRQVFDAFVAKVDAAERQEWFFWPFRDDLSNWLAPLQKATTYKKFLRSLRDKSLPRSKAKDLFLPRLFAAVSGNFSPAALKVLTQWTRSNDPNKIVATATLLSAAPPDFVFDNHAFVADLLERASTADCECYQRTCDYLRESATARNHSRTVGEIAPEYSAFKDQSRTLISRLDPGGPVHRFYESLYEQADREISESVLEDEEIMDQ